MIQNLKVLPLFLLVILVNIGCQLKSEKITIKNTYPWCIVAYDSLERTPSERIKMMTDLGFAKYAYDWRENHLVDSKEELILAQENGIEIISVWIWLNPKRDSVNGLSLSNNKMFNIVDELKLKTILWVGLSESYFKGINHEESLQKATKLVEFVAKKANSINCKVALYNHKGWFGNPLNQIEVIRALPEYNLSLVYNFHHGHENIDNFLEIALKMKPYLSAVNLNGMEKDGEKILTIGEGDFEQEMIKTLKGVGFEGPWGILGHVGKKDVKEVLQKNIDGLNRIETNNISK